MLGATKVVWPEVKLPHGLKPDTFIAPHVLVRSAVFSTLEYSGAKRPTVIAIEPLRLAATSQYRVEQVSGPRLSQTDADTLFWLLARAYRDGTPSMQATSYFKRGEALAALGRSRGGKSDTLLEDSLQRLKTAEFKFEVHDKLGGTIKKSVQTQLLTNVNRVLDESKPYDYYITIADGMAAMLEDNAWSVLSGQGRQKLASDPLAKGLHVYFVSNKQVFAMWPDTLKALMGRDSMQNSKWLQALKVALEKICVAAGWPQCSLVEVGEFAGKVVVRKGGARRLVKTDTPLIQSGK